MFRESQQIGVYTLIRKLGQGGFGEVWLAENRNHSPTEKVAIKLPRTDRIDLQAVKDEIFNWILSGRHKNILPIIECETFGNQVAIVSEYAPDGSLQDLINKKGSLPEREAVEIAVGILDGLAHLHNRKIIHRDLKPDNILFQGNVPRLTDFGISRALTLNSQSQTVSGTFWYMSPETFRGKRNAQTDIWSVGVILYQLLTGKLPFPQRDYIELRNALEDSEPTLLPDSIPSDLQTIAKKALAKESSDRYQTADEMAKELRHFLHEYIRPNPSPIPRSKPVPADADEILFEEDKTEETHISPKPSSKRNLFYFAVSATALVLFVIIGGYWLSGEKLDNSQSKTVDTFLIPFRKGDKFGFSDVNKKLIIDAKYDGAEPFSEEVAKIETDKEYGFIDKTGKEIVSPIYDDAESFSEGLATVRRGDYRSGKYGFIDITGKEVIQLKYDGAGSFKEGLALVESGENCGFIDKTDKIIIQIKYKRCSSFSEGLARVVLDEQVIFIDKSGKEVFPTKYAAAGPFREGLAYVKLNEHYGYINKSGIVVTKFIYDKADSFDGELAMVEIGGENILIDKTGKRVSQINYKIVCSFSNGAAMVVNKNAKFFDNGGFIDKTGKAFTQLKYEIFRIPSPSFKNPLKGGYEECHSIFVNGLELVMFESKKFYIDKNGTEYHEP